jgi:hypothetical protein
MDALRILEVPKDLPGDYDRRQVSERIVESDLAIAGVEADSEFGAAMAAAQAGENSDFARETKSARSDVVSSVTSPLARGGSPVSTGVSTAGQRPFLQEPEIAAPGGNPQGMARGLVPDFRGKTRRDVIQESMATGLPVEVSGEGVAVSQDPPPGAALSSRTFVRVSFRR